MQLQKMKYSYRKILLSSISGSWTFSMIMRIRSCISYNIARDLKIIES